MLANGIYLQCIQKLWLRMIHDLGLHTLRLCLGVWKELKVLGGGKYIEEWINLSHFFFWNSIFLDNDKLMSITNVFLILKIL